MQSSATPITQNEVSGNPIQSVSPFAGSEFTFNNVPVTDILILLLLCFLCDFLILWGPS